MNYITRLPKNKVSSIKRNIFFQKKAGLAARVWRRVRDSNPRCWRTPVCSPRRAAQRGPRIAALLRKRSAAPHRGPTRFAQRGKCRARRRKLQKWSDHSPFHRDPRRANGGGRTMFPRNPLLFGREVWPGAFTCQLEPRNTIPPPTAWAPPFTRAALAGRLTALCGGPGGASSLPLWHLALIPLARSLLGRSSGPFSFRAKREWGAGGSSPWEGKKCALWAQK